jgi:succinoglycan biosynthesis protein ExoH
MVSNLLNSLAVSTREIRLSIGSGTTRLTSSQLSQIISFSRISLIVGLVFLHYERFPNSRVSPFRGIDTEAFQVATFVNSFVLFFFFSVVPLLSMVSGWLFFSFTTNARTELLSRMGRRFKSLYLPLVLWNLAYLVILWMVFKSAPESELLKEIKPNFETAGVGHYVNAVFAITAHPIGFQFWFVRDLFVTVLVSPIIWLMLTRAPWSLLLLGLVWLSGFDLWIFFRADVVFFFALGGLLRLYKAPLEINLSATLWLLGAYILLVSLRTLAPYVVEAGAPLLEVATRSMRLIGVLGCWGVFQAVALSPFGAVVARYGGFAFFLHAAHFPLLAAVKIALWHLVPVENQFWMLLHYLVSVTVTVLIGVSSGLLLARLKPDYFAFLNGGRLAVDRRSS